MKAPSRWRYQDAPAVSRSITILNLKYLHVFVEPSSVVLLFKAPLRRYIGGIFRPLRRENAFVPSDLPIRIVHSCPDLGELKKKTRQQGRDDADVGRIREQSTDSVEKVTYASLNMGTALRASLCTERTLMKRKELSDNVPRTQRGEASYDGQYYSDYMEDGGNSVHKCEQGK